MTSRLRWRFLRTMDNARTVHDDDGNVPTPIHPPTDSTEWAQSDVSIKTTDPNHPLVNTKQNRYLVTFR